MPQGLHNFDFVHCKWTCNYVCLFLHYSISAPLKSFSVNWNQRKAVNKWGAIWSAGEKRKMGRRKGIQRWGNEKWEQGRGSVRDTRWNLESCLELTSSECLEESKEAANKSSELEMQEQTHEKKPQEQECKWERDDDKERGRCLLEKSFCWPEYGCVVQLCSKRRRSLSP